MFHLKQTDNLDAVSSASEKIQENRQNPIAHA